MIWRIFILISWSIFAIAGEARTVISLQDVRFVDGNLSVLFSRTDGHYGLFGEGIIEGITSIHECVVRDGVPSSRSLGTGNEFMVTKYRYRFAEEGVVGVARLGDANWNNKGVWLYKGAFHDLELDPQADCIFSSPNGIGIVRGAVAFRLAADSRENVLWEKVGAVSMPRPAKEDRRTFLPEVFAAGSSFFAVRFKGLQEEIELVPVPEGPCVKLPDRASFIGIIARNESPLCVYRDREKGCLSIINFSGKVAYESAPLSVPVLAPYPNLVLISRGDEVLLFTRSLGHDLQSSYVVWNLVTNAIEQRKIQLK